MTSTLKCLFCQNSVDIDKVSCKTEVKHQQVAQVLKEVFTTLCNLLQLKFTSTGNIWDFKEKTFPFCKQCRNDIAGLLKLRKDISKIEKNIKQILLKFLSLTLESYAREGAGGVNNPDRNTAKSVKYCGADNNNSYYENLRQQIINRYSPSIKVEQCEWVSNSAGPFATSETEQQEDGSPVYENEGDAVIIKAEEITSDEYEPSSSCCEDDAVNEPSSPISYTSVTSLHTTNSVPENPLKKINKVESTSKKRRIPGSYKVTLIEGTTFVYRNTRLTIDDDEITCLECGFKTKPTQGPKGPHHNIREHIKSRHCGKSGEAFVPSIKTKLIDKATQTYSFEGFRFRTNNDGHLCLTCGLTAKIPLRKEKRSTFVNIRNHIKVVHLKIRKKECKICRDGILRNNLTYHNAAKHAKNSTSNVCHICGKRFRNRMNLSSHLSGHKKADHQCDTCGKKFIKKWVLKLHMMTHTGEKPFICEKCGKGFVMKQHLETHIPIHKKIRPFACKQCNWSFGANYLLTRHIKQVHEGIKPPPPKKRKKLSSASEGVKDGNSNQDK